jgi:hypothetical protein
LVKDSVKNENSSCELELGRFNKRVKVPPANDGTFAGELPTWKNCPRRLIMHPVVCVCPIGNGCLFGYFGSAAHGTSTEVRMQDDLRVMPQGQTLSRRGF